MAAETSLATGKELALGLTPVEIGVGIVLIAGITWGFRKVYQGLFGGGKTS